VLWLVVVVPALLLLPSQWDALTRNFGEQALAAGNLLLLTVLFPLVKVVHELGHGLICKWRGGEVHETGVMLLAGYPVPFVDASSASALASKWQRALVAAAGMLVELFVAALAFYAWLLLEPGLARSIAWNVAVLASVTTLFFNANPLLRYDGYYILSDLIEIPNLATRANRHWQYLADRHVFGVRDPERPPATVGERRWFTGYAPLSYVYRLFVSLTIAVFVAQHFLVVGVLFGLWTVGQGVLWPIFKGLRALATAPRYADRGQRIRAVLAGGATLAALLLFVVPVPFHTQAEGVLWLHERAILRAESSGFVREVVARPGAALAAGQPVVEFVEPALAARIAAQQARVEEFAAQVDAAWLQSQARVQQLEQQLAVEQASLERLQEEARGLTLRAGVAGTLLLDRPVDLPGRWLRKGEVVGYLHTGDAPLVRVVVPQSAIDPVRLTTRAVEVRLPQEPGRSLVATLERSVPAATRTLPSAVLGTQGGGEFAVDPRDAEGRATLESVFEFELQLPIDLKPRYLGSRVHVRFEHEPEAVGLRWARALRRAFLSLFHV
jgi:putative peptide zinc metalloprotease protein